MGGRQAGGVSALGQVAAGDQQPAAVSIVAGSDLAEFSASTTVLRSPSRAVTLGRVLRHDGAKPPPCFNRVGDFTYLTQLIITSTNFKREADDSKWKPSSRRARSQPYLVAHFGGSADIPAGGSRSTSSSAGRK